jgi:adenylate cyclase
MSLAFCSAGTVRRWRRDVPGTIEVASRAIGIGSEHGLPRWQNHAAILLAWARCQGEGPAPSDTAEHLQKAHEAVIASTPVMRTWVTPPFVETCARLGRGELALRELSDGLAHAERTGERAWEPEIHRFRGELVKTKNLGEAKRSFEKAIEVAERQSSRSFLLRAATSLHRLSTTTKEQARSRAILEHAYGAFTEGFDTGDLRDARSLLE